MIMSVLTKLIAVGGIRLLAAGGLGAGLTLGWVGTSVAAWWQERQLTAAFTRQIETLAAERDALSAANIDLSAENAELTGTLAAVTQQLRAIDQSNARVAAAREEEIARIRARLHQTSSELEEQRLADIAQRDLFDLELERAQHACLDFVPSGPVVDDIVRLWDETYGAGAHDRGNGPHPDRAGTGPDLPD